jgi:membrane protease YdiL (CAAX protease family)
MKTLLASLAAVAVQPLMFLARIAPDLIASAQATYGVGFFLLAVGVVAAAVVPILGIPAFLVLRRFRRDSWSTRAPTGLILGALPTAFAWPRHLEGYSAGSNWHGKYVQTYVDGAPTECAWLSFVENLIFFGLHGLVGALVFYGVWRRLARAEDRLQPAV